MKSAAAGTAGRVVTGAEYVAQITTVRSDRQARSAFHERVVALAPPGAKLLDFGCGTGLDARFYAGRGFTVWGYDVDPQMCDYFAEHCGDLIEAGRVKLERGPYSQFLRSTAVSGIDLVTSNFAPLNLIADLPELFARFHALTAPDGKVLASVLSPYFAGDLRYGWWWSNLPRLLRAGHYSVPGAQAPIIRRRLANLETVSAPHFRLSCVFRGLPPMWSRRVPNVKANAVKPTAWLRAVSSRFMFLLFEKLPA